MYQNDKKKAVHTYIFMNAEVLLFTFNGKRQT